MNMIDSKSSNDFLEQIGSSDVQKLYGRIKRADINGKNLKQVLLSCFGNYVIKATKNGITVYISSSTASLNFIYNDELYSEEEMVDLIGYSREYQQSILSLGMSYANKDGMFGRPTITLLPGCFLIMNREKRGVHTRSWYDMMITPEPDQYSLENMQRGVLRYIKGRKIYLLTSGGVDTAFLVSILHHHDDIVYASIRLDRSGGNNTPEDASILLKKMLSGAKYKHLVFSKVEHDIINESTLICTRTIDRDLVEQIDVGDKVAIITGQNSDSILSPGMVKGDSVTSYFQNWGAKGGLKALLLNTLIVSFKNPITRTIMKLICSIVNVPLQFSGKIILDYSVKGFYYGSWKGVPFFYNRQKIPVELEKNFSSLNNLFPSSKISPYQRLLLIKIYTYSTQAMQSQKGTCQPGYEFIHPYNSTEFIGYGLNNSQRISEIWSPKISMLNHVYKSGLDKKHKFYHKNY